MFLPPQALLLRDFLTPLHLDGLLSKCQSQQGLPFFSQLWGMTLSGIFGEKSVRLLMSAQDFWEMIAQKLA